VRDITIIEAARTPVVESFLGSLSSVRADDLGASIIDALLNRSEFLDAGDDAGPLVLASAEWAARMGAEPLARTTGASVAGSSPEMKGPTTTCVTGVQQASVLVERLR
jgi:acetyl-CoA acetyltransferase